MIKSQQLSLRNDAVRKLLGLPDTRAQVGYRAQKSPLEVPEMMQACPSTLCAVVIFIIRNWIMTLKFSWIQWSQLEDANLQTKSMPSDKGTASESTTPNFAMGSMDGNISASSSPEELLEVWMLTHFFCLGILFRYEFWCTYLYAYHQQALQYLGTGCRDQAIPLIR